MSQRRALDHVLRVVTRAPCGESLVLRGSMTMLAWVGDRARPPGDLDWVVRAVVPQPVDLISPYPYLDRLDPVRTWPEAAHGATGTEMWEFEDFDTGGFAPRLPPEGLAWIHDEEMGHYSPVVDVIELLGRYPKTDDGLVLEPSEAEFTWLGGSGYGGYGGETGAVLRGQRVRVPWHTADASGTVQLDFAFDEPLPDPPTFAAVPRIDGGPPTVARSASRELSLMWKVRWLAADLASEGRVAGKDLYDTVLLVELDRLRLPERLRRDVMRNVPDPDAVRDWAVDWDTIATHAAGKPSHWLGRLASGLRRVVLP
jgi:hypothetical protein